MKSHLDLHLERCRMPRGGLQAAEFEAQGLGFLQAIGRSVSYVDRTSGVALLSFSYPSEQDAKMQMKFFREAYRDVEERRSSFKAVAS